MTEVALPRCALDEVLPRVCDSKIPSIDADGSSDSMGGFKVSPNCRRNYRSATTCPVFV